MIRELIASNIGAIIAAFDSHDASIQQDGNYRCACKLICSSEAWEAHLAAKIADVLTEQVVQLPLIDAIGRPA